VIFLTGCSFLTPKEKIKYVYPETFAFRLQNIAIDGNITPIKPYNLNGKINLSKDNKSVVMSVKTWIELREDSKRRRELNFLLRKNLNMFILGYKQYENDIKKYIEWSKKWKQTSISKD
jgi:hypothetical protein